MFSREIHVGGCFTKAEEGVTVTRYGDLRLVPFGRNLGIITSIMCRLFITFPSQSEILQKVFFGSASIGQPLS